MRKQEDGAKMDDRFDRIENRLDGHDENFFEICKRFDRIDKKLEEHDEKFVEIDKRFDGIDKKLEKHDQRFDRIDQRFDKMDKKFDVVDRHFSWLIEKMDALFDLVSDNAATLDELLMNTATHTRRSDDQENKAYRRDRQLADHEERISKLEAGPLQAG